MFSLLLSVFCLSPALPAGANDVNFPEVMIILDASGSMWGTAGEQVKIKAATDVLHQLIPSLPNEVKLGLTVYGHRRKGDCTDIEIMLAAGSDDRELLLKKVDAIKPKGKTPMADSIKMVVDELRNKENETTIILVSDGKETCNPDPCGVVKKLKATGIKFVLHVVGFDVDQKIKQELACLASAGGGKYFDAADGDALLAALQTVQAEVVKKVEFEKAKTTTTKKKSGLGKLRITFPSGGEKSLAHIRIVRTKDHKNIKTVTSPAADATHPLLSGEYEVIFGYANSNYSKASEIGPIAVTINGGETTEMKLGGLIFNIADNLKKLPADSVTLRRDDGQVVLMTPDTGNNYFFFTPKPLPPGKYSFEYFYKTMKIPVIAANDIEIQAGEKTVLTLDSGVKIKKHKEDMVAFDLVDKGTGKPVIQVQRRTDNNYPIWYAFAVPPGNYNLLVYLRGMDEPLPVADNIVIKHGELLEIDTGL